MKKHIIVPFNFTPIAEAGLATAISIAKNIKAGVRIVHVIDEPNVRFNTMADMLAVTNQSSENDRFMAELVRKRKAQLDELIQGRKEKEPEYSSEILFGPFEAAMEEYLEETDDVLMVVMGTSGEASISEFFSGNHTSQTMRASNVPVLSVKDFYLTTGMDQLLLLINTYEYEESTLKMIKNLVELLDLQLTIAYVKETTEKNEHMIKSMMHFFATDRGLDEAKIKVLPLGDKIDEVQKYVDSQNVDLVASITSVKSKFVRLFYGSDTEDFATSLEQPVIAFPE